MQRAKFEALIAGLECHGISRTEIAQRTGLSRDTVWRLATGTVRYPNYETADRLRDLAEKTFLNPVRPV
jgi:transcriptional regulator with XRE-family HTH domain